MCWISENAGSDIDGRVSVGEHCRTENDGRSLCNARMCAALEQTLCRISFALRVIYNLLLKMLNQSSAFSGLGIIICTAVPLLGDRL